MKPDVADARRLLTAAVLVIAVAAVSACGDTLAGDATGPDGSPPDGTLRQGTVQFVSVEGGCWAIDTPEERYEPVDLPEEFREDGLEVRFEGEVRDDMASVCMVGQLFELETVRRADG